MISLKFNEPTHNKIAIKIKPIATSQDTNCAAERNAPKKAYLELLDQPDKITPNTPNDEAANTKSKPNEISTKKPFKPKGMKDQPNKLSKNVNIGEKTKLKVLELVGITVSLSNSFKPSTSG